MPLIALEPSQSSARRWLEEELRKPEYRDAGKSLIDRFQQWWANQIASVDGLPAHLGAVLLVIVLLAIGVVILLWAGPMRLNRRSSDQSAALFAGRPVDAAEYRARASRCAAEEDWSGAVRQAFRALVREQIDRSVVPDLPGLTASEAADACVARYPDHASDLHRAAKLFDAVWFGGRQANREDYLELAGLDARLLATRPRSVSSATSLAAPR